VPTQGEGRRKEEETVQREKSPLPDVNAEQRGVLNDGQRYDPEMTFRGTSAIPKEGDEGRPGGSMQSFATLTRGKDTLARLARRTSLKGPRMDMKAKEGESNGRRLLQTDRLAAKNLYPEEDLGSMHL